MLKRLKLWWLRVQLDAMDSDIILADEQAKLLRANAMGLEAFLQVKRGERALLRLKLHELADPQSLIESVPNPNQLKFEEIGAKIYNREFEKRP